MNRTSGHRLLCSSILTLVLTLAAPLAHASDWTTPTPEELSMTSQPQVPGASAVYLYREETTEDDMHEFNIYTRLKVLTEGGKKYGDVELYYGSGHYGSGITIGSIEGRTIQPDGTIVPFTGKPYDKLIVKSHGDKVMSKVFSMPDVRVGSIIEYRYRISYNDNFYMAPNWYIQSDLFTRKAHYVWKPTTRELVSDKGGINTIGWFPILPPGAEVKNTVYPGTSMKPEQHVLEVNVENVPPIADEDYMPPIASLSYRVLFYYSTYRSGEEFWKQEGKNWSKDRDKFIGHDHEISDAVAQLTSPNDTQDQKLRKIYAAIMQLENTDFTRVHSTAEEKAEGLKEVHDAADIWKRKRGDDDQLTELFVAMARAAGMKAYIIDIVNRDRNLFLKSYLSFRQFNDYLAIVNVDGKEEFFDPGSRYCPYGHLAWKHTDASGIRQNDAGTVFSATPEESYTTSRTDRIADLAMNDQGVAIGIVKMTYLGAPALAWRQKSLTGDATSLNDELREAVQALLPQGMDVKVSSIDDLTNYEQPLVATFDVKGPIGSATGKRLFYTGDLFATNTKAAFPNPTRDLPVYISYPSIVQDAVRVKFPATFRVESSPADTKVPFKSLALYTMSTSPAPDSVTVRRDYILGTIIFMPKEYQDLRAFYSKIEAKDQESVVLETTPSTKSTTAAN